MLRWIVIAVCVCVVSPGWAARQAGAGPAPQAASGALPADAEAPTVVLAPTPGRSARPLGVAPAPRARNDEAAGSVQWVSRTVLPTALVLGLILLAAGIVRAVARRSGGVAACMGAGGRAPPGILSVLGRYPVGGGLTLVLLQLDQRILLVSHSPGSVLRSRPGSMNILCEICDEEEVASILQRAQDERGESLTMRFNEMLQRFTERHDALDLEVPDEDIDSPLRARLERLRLLEQGQARGVVT